MPRVRMLIRRADLRRGDELVVSDAVAAEWVADWVAEKVEADEKAEKPGRNKAMAAKENK